MRSKRSCAPPRPCPTTARCARGASSSSPARPGDAFGDALAAAAAEQRTDLDDDTRERIRSKAFVAPALIAVSAHVEPTAKVPVWEQVASATCAGYAIALAAHQLGLGAIWKSAPVHEGSAIEKALDLSPDDVFLGWVNLGQTGSDRVIAERSAVDLGAVARVLDVDGTPLRYER